MKEFIFIWRIENISFSWHSTGEEICSPSFIAGPIQNSAWTLKLYPRGKLDCDYLSLFLYRGVDECPENISVNFQISCISAENSSLHSFTFSESEKSFANNDEFGHPRFMRRQEVFFQRKSLYLPEETLTLRCKMWKSESNGNASGESFGLTRLDIERIFAGDIIKRQIGTKTTRNIHSNRQNKEELISIDTLQCEADIVVEIKPISVVNMKFCVFKLWFANKSNRQILCCHNSSWLGPPQKEIWRLDLACKALNIGTEDSVENSVELVGEFVYSTGEETKQLENKAPHLSRCSELVSKYIMNCIPSGNVSNFPRISQELWNLYAEKVVCDVELKTEGASVYAHKFVLCARSPVFLAMLTDEMKEVRHKCIELEDHLGYNLQEFLNFLYTDAFEDYKWMTVMSLYYASDKYQVARLKVLCSSCLMKDISVHNVGDLLILAVTNKDSDLKRRVEDFIVRNHQDIFSSGSWKIFANEEPSLAVQTMLLKYDTERENENSAETYEEMLRRLPNVHADFTAACQLETITDIVIKTTDATFKAHRSVLCASSSIIRKKLSKDPKDKPTDILEIPDFESDVVSHLLFFLNTDSLGALQWDTAIKLYEAANVYQIHRLKIKCSCFLLENLETSKASKLLLLAHEHHDATLKPVIEDYIFLHDEEIFGSDGWADLSKTNPQLVIEIMRSKYKRRCGISPPKTLLNCD